MNPVSQLYDVIELQPEPKYIEDSISACVFKIDKKVIYLSLCFTQRRTRTKVNSAIVGNA